MIDEPIPPPPAPEPTPFEPLPPIEPPPPPPAMQAQVEVATRLVVAVGHFPSGSPDPAVIEVVDLDQAEWEALRSAGPGQKYLAEDGTLTVVPAPPPPLTYSTVATVDTRVRTTDDVPLEAFRFATKPKHAYRLTVRMTAIDANSGTMKDSEVRMSFRASASSLTQVGTTAVLYNVLDTGAASWAVQPSVQFPDLVISVRGALGRVIDWLCVVDAGQFNPEGF